MTYELALYVADKPEEAPERRNSVFFPVRKVQFAPAKTVAPSPLISVTRTFTLTSGSITLELQLERDLCYHGHPLEAQVFISNASKKTMKHLTVQVMQHVEVTVSDTHFSAVVSSIDTYEGCPVTPNSFYSKTIVLTLQPLRAHGVALEGHAQDQDANLASSTIMSTASALNDVLGIIVSYSLRVTLNCGSIGGELSTELPFKLMHTDQPGTKACLQRTQSAVDYNLVIEEYSALRRGKSLVGDLED